MKHPLYNLSVHSTTIARDMVVLKVNMLDWAKLRFHDS